MTREPYLAVFTSCRVATRQPDKLKKLIGLLGYNCHRPAIIGTDRLGLTFCHRPAIIGTDRLGLTFCHRPAIIGTGRLIFEGVYMDKNEELLSTGKAGKMLGRKADTIRAWLKSGYISGYEDNVTGKFFVPMSEIERVGKTLLKPVQPTQPPKGKVKRGAKKKGKGQ